MSAGASAAAARLVGRQRELDALRTQLAAAAGGNGSVAMIFGEPGVGKTRLAHEFAGIAGGEGAIVCFGTCYEREGSPLYGPWVEVLTQCAQRVDPSASGESTAIVAGVVPGLESDSQLQRLSSEEERIRFFEAVAQLFATSEQPIVVLLDDLQWADRPALDLLEYVARSLAKVRLLVVGAHRDVELTLQHPLNECLAELSRQRRYEPLQLRPLTLDEAAALAEQLAAGPVSAASVAAIHTETAGNPFFIEEVVRQVREEGFDLASEAPAPELWGISPTARQAVSRRLARLSTELNRLLGVASAFAGPFTFEVLPAATELDEASLLDCLDEALAAGVIRPVGGMEAYEFSHSLVRQTLYDELSPSRRARLHRRVAQALERTYFGRESEAAAELAGQYSRSRSLPGAEQGVRFALLAAERAAERYAHAEAVTYLRIARDLASWGEAAARAEILGRLALAEVDALMLNESLETVEETLIALADAGAEPGAVADFLRLTAWSLQDAGAPGEAVASLVERGLVSTSERRDLTWARLKLAERPVRMLSAGPLRVGRWLGFDSEAVRIARESGNEADYARTIELMDWRSRSETDALYRLVQTWSNPSAAIHGLSVIVRDLVTKHGAFVEAEEVCTRLVALGERVGSVPARAFGLLYLAHVNAARGDLAGAHDSLSRAGEVIDRLGSGHRLRVLRGFVEFVLGQYTDVDLERLARIESERALDPRTPPWLTLLRGSTAAYAHARSGATDEARRLLGWVVPALVELDPTTINQGGAVFFAGAAAWELGETQHARELRTLALELIASEVADYTPVSTELTVARTAALLEDPDEARAYFDRARAGLEERGTRPLRAIADYDEALTLRRQDVAGAARLLGAARREFVDLEMTGWIERADALLSLGGAYPGGLTAREAEVLRLLSGGRTNKQIASELVISVHTVERHLATIYRKIGAKNRADATAFAHTNGLAVT